MNQVNTKSQYFMDDPREAGRLAEKVDPAQWVRRYVEPWLGESGRVLDVGCGPGVIAAAMARARLGVQVVGLDLSENRLALAEQQQAGVSNLLFRRGNALSLPFADDEFDLVHCRFLMEYLPDKPLAVREMLRVLRPGGRIILQDLDGQLVWHHPVDAALQAGIEKSLAMLARTGFDPLVGRKLYALLHAAGTSHLQVSVDPYHLYAGTIDPANEALWQTKLDIARPAIEEALGGPDPAAELIARFMNYLRDPATLSYSVVFTVTGAKPARDESVFSGNA